MLAAIELMPEDSVLDREDKRHKNRSDYRSELEDRICLQIMYITNNAIKFFVRFINIRSQNCNDSC